MSRSDIGDIEITEGSGDVFADLGIELSEEERFKIFLASEITKVMHTRGLTQTEAAVLAGADQAKISKVTRGILKGFSADRLIGYLLSMGYDLDVQVRESGKRHGSVNMHSLEAAAL